NGPNGFTRNPVRPDSARLVPLLVDATRLRPHIPPLRSHHQCPPIIPISLSSPTCFALLAKPSSPSFPSSPPQNSSMATAAVTAAVSFPSSKSSALNRTPSVSPASLERLSFQKASPSPYFFAARLQSRKVPAADARKLVSVRAQVTTDAPAKVAKVSKKDDEGVVTNKFKPKNPYTGTCLLNTKITGDDAPGETWHMVFSTEGNPGSAYVRAYTSGFYCVRRVHRLQEKSPTERDNPSEFEKMKDKSPDNFRVDYAVSREQTNEKEEKMYIQTRMAEYAEELWQLLKKENTYVYMCGLKGMEKGIDDIMVSLAAKDGIDWFTYKRELKRGDQWNVEVY
ncbi:hypothetical protein GW17_00052567, partial [Ensete ventricosum]